MKRLIPAAFLFCFCSGAWGADCGDMLGAYHLFLKTAAESAVKMQIATEEKERAAELSWIGFSLTSAQINLTLLIQHKCTLPEDGAMFLRYASEAAKCQKLKIEGKKDAPECDKSNWTGGK